MDIKGQFVLQFGASRGRSEVRLALRGRGYLLEIVSKFGPKIWPWCRDREARMISTQILTVRELVAAVQLIHQLEQYIYIEYDLVQRIELIRGRVHQKI